MLMRLVCRCNALRAKLKDIAQRTMSVTTLHDVEGLSGQMNTVVHCPPSSVGCHGNDGFKGDVIFFPGDLQDFTSIMAGHYQCVDFVKWSYEETLMTLSKKFPQAHIWLIAPSKKAYQTICVYKNFMNVKSILGIPEHCQEYNGLEHFECLFRNAQTLIRNKFTDYQCNNQIILVGFSKGCVVLNQFLYELSSPEKSDQLAHRIEAIYWLDGGHTGEKDVWVTDPEIITALKSTAIARVKMFIHVTPYQVRDDHRPWKGESEAMFNQLLINNHFNVSETLHFEDQEPTIDLHFKVFEAF